MTQQRRRRPDDDPPITSNVKNNSLVRSQSSFFVSVHKFKEMHTISCQLFYAIYSAL